MANQSEMLGRLRALYMPRAINIADMAARVEACAAYWQLLTPAQRNAIAMLNKDAAIWKAAWDAQEANIQALKQWTQITGDPATWPAYGAALYIAWDNEREGGPGWISIYDNLGTLIQQTGEAPVGWYWMPIITPDISDRQTAETLLMVTER